MVFGDSCYCTTNVLLLMNASSQINKKVYSTFAIVTNNQPLPPEQDRAVLMILESHHGTEYILYSSLYILVENCSLYIGKIALHWDSLKISTICHPNSTRCSD